MNFMCNMCQRVTEIYFADVSKPLTRATSPTRLGIIQLRSKLHAIFLRTLILLVKLRLGVLLLVFMHRGVEMELVE